MLAETFDPGACKFPFGYLHDLSLVEVLDHATMSTFKPPMPLQWLSADGWSRLKFKTTQLFLLEDVDSAERNTMKSIELQETQYQVRSPSFRFEKPRYVLIRSRSLAKVYCLIDKDQTGSRTYSARTTKVKSSITGNHLLVVAYYIEFHLTIQLLADKVAPPCA